MGPPEELILLVFAWPLGPPFPACSLPLGHETLTQCTSNFSLGRGEGRIAVIWFLRLPWGQLWSHHPRDTDTFRNDLSLPEGASSIVEGSVPQAPSHWWNAFFISLGGWRVGHWALPSEIKLFRKAFHFCQFLANAKLTKAVHFTHRVHWIYKWLWQWAYLWGVSQPLSTYSRQYYGLGFFLLLLFCIGLKVKGWGCGSVGKRLACQCSSEQPKPGAMCLSSRGRKVRHSGSSWATWGGQPSCGWPWLNLSNKPPSKSVLKIRTLGIVCPCWHHRVTVTVMGNSMHGLFCK